MDKKSTRNTALQKENDNKYINKKEEVSLHKMERALLVKPITIQDSHNLRIGRNTKELRAPSKSTHERVNKPIELKPLQQMLNNTQQYCMLYAHDLIKQSAGSTNILGNFLINHDIDKLLRARMLDWMIEVVSSYKFNAKTYFSSVHLMDSYFQKQDKRLPITKLHITGVTAMLIATKMDEVYPLKIRTVHEKIVHKKIEKRDLVDMQARMTDKLNFFLNVWSFYDLALLKLHQNWQLKNQEVIKQMEQICEQIGKFVVFNYELYGRYEVDVLSQATLRAAFKVLGSEKTRACLGERQLSDLSSNQQSIGCMELIFDTIKGFPTVFKNLNNVYKFGEPLVLQKLEQFLKHYECN